MALGTHPIRTLPIGLIALGAAIIWFAPPEQSLGSGIKFVYIHVALIWAGTLGILLAGSLGLGFTSLGVDRMLEWARVIGRVSLALYGLGVVTSMAASWANWGGIAWLEPRTFQTLAVLLAAVSVQVVDRGDNRGRLRGILHLAVAIILLASARITPIVLHPTNAVAQTDSVAIRLSFFGLFLVCCALGVVAVARLLKAPLVSVERSRSDKR